MSLFVVVPEDAIYLSRKDSRNPLASYSRHDIELDDQIWPSVEHYFHGMKFDQPALREKICAAPNPVRAAKMARWNFWKVRKDWGSIQRVVMTRGTYTKCCAYPEVAEALLSTGGQMLVESDVYNNYWGCGRDQRGRNYYGQMLMNVREKLRSQD